MDSTNPDLSRFAARGGKLVILENMADYAQSPYAGIRYFENVQRTLGKEKTAAFARLYTAPGVDHVGSGAPANVDMLAVLVDWVENGKAPGDLEVTEQKVEAPAFETTRALPLVPVAGVAALQIGRSKSRRQFYLRAVNLSRDLARALRDQPRGALVAGVDPQPAQRDAEAVAQADQEVDVGEAPDPPGEVAAQLDPAEIDHGLASCRSARDCRRACSGTAAACRRRGAP